MKKLIETFIVREYEVDKDLRLRLDTLANYMEEVAGKHATEIGVGMQKLVEHNLSWVMSKLRIKIEDLPVAGETVVMLTWPSDMQRGTYRRDFTLQREDGTLLASAVTWWIIFDLQERKLAQLPANISFPGTLNETPLDGTIKITPIKNKPDATSGVTFPVRLFDIDQNNHVNNVRYISFLQELALPYLPNSTTKLDQLDIVFRAESHYGDTITSTSARETKESLSIIHSLYVDEREIVRGRTIWK